MTYSKYFRDEIHPHPVAMDIHLQLYLDQLFVDGKNTIGEAFQVMYGNKEIL